ncbi:MAG TPA: DUF4126 family protein [Terriglobales bacterium]
MALFLLFLLGAVDGLRSLTAPALVCWAAHFGWLHFAGSRLAFIDHPGTLVIFTLLAIVELVLDKLPNTPSRTAPVGLIARIVLGAASCIAVAFATGMPAVLAGVIGAAGAIAGAFGGYNIRHELVVKLRLPDTVVALAEDLTAITGGLLIVSRF